MSATPGKAPGKGLGKGLSALMSESYSQSVDAATAGAAERPATGMPTNMLPTSAIRSGKFQPRQHFRQEQLEELAESIKKNGIMQPIIVRPHPAIKGSYEIIAGERRWRAAQIAKQDLVPVIIRELSDQQALELALVENIQRQDLTPLEEAAGYQRLIDEFSYTQEELAGTVGKSRSHVANLLRLLALPNELKEMVEKGELTMGHARALLGVEKPIEMAKEIIRRGLNVRQTENFVKNGNILIGGKNQGRGGGAPRQSSSGSNREKDQDILALEETLSDNLGLKVSINDRGQNGEIVIAYNSLGELDEILRRLGGSI